MSGGRVLVAGVGNVFFGDDGFGVEVAHRLCEEHLPEGVEVSDYGIRGVHLAYALLEPTDLLVIVDTVSRGGAPGTLYLIEPETTDGRLGPEAVDAHGMNLVAVFAAVTTMGGALPRTLIVGVEAAEISERMELSAPVRAAVEPAVQMIRGLLERELAEPERASPLH